MSEQNFESNPTLSDEQWCADFVAFMVKIGGPMFAGPLGELREYAEQAARAYLPNRREYTGADEAAGTDISYWEDDGV
jgi:hypothetical protein